MARFFRASLSWQEVLYTLTLFLTISTVVTIFRSWLRSNHSDAYHEKANINYFAENAENTDLPFNQAQRIVHVPDDITNADHCVFYNFLRGSNISVDYEPITLALHSTINYAEYLVKQAEDWDDVLSYAVFLFPKHDEALEALAMLHKCHDEINRKVSIHLVWNRNFLFESCVDHDIIDDISAISENIESCDVFDLDNVLSKLRAVKNPFGSYPINVMRNEARRGAATKLHIIGDIETRYSPSFAHNVRHLAQQLLNDDFGKAVLVYRRFEMDENERFPRDLPMLATLYADRKIVQFHEKHYRVGHYIPNLREWLEYSLNNNDIWFDNVSYTTTEWEPQFIMRYDAPYHYEHVPTRMMDHQFLCYELCRAGYSYLVMTHVYNIHPGIKKESTPMEKSLSMFGLTQTGPTLRKFRAYINARYPIYQKSTCPNWKNYL